MLSSVIQFDVKIPILKKYKRKTLAHTFIDPFDKNLPSVKKIEIENLATHSHLRHKGIKKSTKSKC